MAIIEQFSSSQQFLFLVFGLIFNLLLLAFLFYRFNKTRISTEQIYLKGEESARLLTQALHSMSNLESNQKEAQTRLFNLLSEDRERQLNSLTQLRVELEKRFSDSSTSLTNNFQTFKSTVLKDLTDNQAKSSKALADGQQAVSQTINEFTKMLTEQINDAQTKNTSLIGEAIRKGVQDLRLDLDRNTGKQTEMLRESISQLNSSTDSRLKEISGQVERRLNEGFEKTTKTFNDVLKRLALIDEAQKKITELSSNVVGLQEILNDKRSRGAFGEVQLKTLVSNTMPESHYSMQYRFPNETIADCVLILPEPTGKIAIDAKFPLENYRRMTDLELAESDRKDAARQFSRDIKKHISDIAKKYILPPETSDGAVMFIPAESVFAEIHGHFPELVEYAYQQKVWMVSPTTLMAILTTATAVIKDEQTRKQVHIIKEHLSALGKDFGRFETRMNNLSKHIGMVSKDVEQVHTSAKKISSRFDKIERVELSNEGLPSENLESLSNTDENTGKSIGKNIGENEMNLTVS